MMANSYKMSSLNEKVLSEKFIVFHIKNGLEKFKFQQPLVWRNIIGITVLHIFAFIGLLQYPFRERFFTTVLWAFSVGFISGLGVTIGAHRLWTHRSYKARLPLRILLMCCFLTSGQYSMVQWAKDHRLHHKFSDTEADPHNSKRGFFYSHMGWLMMKRTPESKAKGKVIDLSDLWADPVVRFQQKYFPWLFTLWFIIFPCSIPWLYFGDTLWELIIGTMAIRYVIQLHCTWIVNSVAHMWGYRPYNKNIPPVENRVVAYMTCGEGFHNYHHVFPWDYRAAEFGMEPNISTRLINIFASLGLAYDLKSCSPDMVKKVMARTGGDPHQVVSEEDIKNLNVDKLKEF